MRLLHKGACLADTLSALFIWEHDFYPQLYLPKSAFCKPRGFEIDYEDGEAIKDAETGRTVATEWVIRIKRSGKATGGEGGESVCLKGSVVWFAEDLAGPGEVLKGLVKVKFDAVGES